MNAPTEEPTSARLRRLEEKIALAEDLLDQLNQTVFRQQQQIEWLARELLSLRDAPPGGADASDRRAQDERPPHY